MAPTATATKSLRRAVSRILGMKNSHVIAYSPCKTNLMYAVSAFVHWRSHYPRTQASRVMQSGLSVYMYEIFFLIERTRDLIYLKFVATDFFPKTISPSAGENSGNSA